MVVKNVTSTEFREKSGLWLDEAGKSPIIITKHDRPSRVVMDYDMYLRLAAYDTRRHIWASELTDEELAELEGAKMDPRHDHLNAELKS